MKLKIIIFLIFVTSGLSAMQPSQWIRNAQLQEQAELRTEDAAAATQELGKLAETYYFTWLTKNERFELINKTKQLLQRGANPNVITQAHPAIADYALALAIPVNPEIVELLLKAGADPDTIKKESSEPVIFSAIFYNSPAIVKTLLDYNANPNKTWIKGTTPLLYTIYSDKNPAIVDILLKYLADPNKSDDFGKTPLDEAIEKENIYIIKLLLQAGANADLYNTESLKARLKSGKKAIYQLILDMLEMYSAKQKAKIL